MAPFSGFQIQKKNATTPWGFCEEQASEILCKPMEEQNPQFTTGSSAAYNQDEKRSSVLAAH